eukprot:Partr_v1_DN28356_c1_g1_i1_m78991 putative Cell division cycle 20
MSAGIKVSTPVQNRHCFNLAESPTIQASMLREDKRKKSQQRNNITCRRKDGSTPLLESPVLRSLRTPNVRIHSDGHRLSDQVENDDQLLSSHFRKLSFNSATQSPLQPSTRLPSKKNSLVSTPVTAAKESVGDEVAEMLQQLGLDRCNSIRKTSPIAKLKHRHKLSPPKRAGHRNALLNSPGQWQQKKKSTTAAYDRFIPNRSAMDLNTTQVNMRKNSTASNNHTSSSISSLTFTSDNNMTTEDFRLDRDSKTYQYEVAKACGLALDKRILAFNKNQMHDSRVEPQPSKLQRPIRGEKTMAAKRRIPTAPERILDAPGIADDFYRSLLDWSQLNVLAVGLGSSVYLWDATQGGVNELCSIDDEAGVASVSWSQDGSYVAVGDCNGRTQLWDVETGSRIRTLHDRSMRVGVLSWNAEVLSCGSQNGAINNHDVRLPQSRIHTMLGHESDVCGLKWSPDGTQLASGGNDNLVNIWDARSSQPRYTMRDHTAAVKAVGWCPWQSNLLATGGGSDDKKIHFWNTATGALNSSIDTGAQVTGVIWSKTYRELISTHGYADNQMMIWKYSTMKKIMELPHAHESRILHSAISPDGQVVCTGAADENLKFWKVFAMDAKQVKTKTSGASKDGGSKKNISPDLAVMNIR